MQFCDRCGVPFSDNTTRCLCAAVHRDEKFCNAAIEEFLVEPVRAVPPSPGADAAAVLGDAVAARFRRRVRDTLLLALLVGFVVAAPGLFLLWIVAAVAVYALTQHREARASTATMWIVGGIVVLAALFVLPRLFGFGRAALLIDPFYLIASGDGGTIALLLGAVAFVIVLADECAVAVLTRSCFRRDRFVPHPGAAQGIEARLRTLGRAAFAAGLQRVAVADAARNSARAGTVGEVLVHREYSPFLGSGTPRDVKLRALPLVPDDGAIPAAIDVLELHSQVEKAIRALADPTSSLGPGGRLRALDVREQVLASAEQLLTAQPGFPRNLVLASTEQPPAQFVPVDAARAMATDPPEWARYYRCYRVEAWDRDLAASCFVHFGTDANTLYLERVACLLPPLRRGFRDIDRPGPLLGPLGSALLTLITLPARVPAMLRSVFRLLRPMRQLPGEVIPDRYGAASSLRELAAHTGPAEYFKDADGERYLGILDSTLERAIGSYLEERGYSVVEFQKAIAPTINDFRNSSIAGSAFGTGASVVNGTGSSSTSTATKEH